MQTHYKKLCHGLCECLIGWLGLLDLSGNDENTEGDIAEDVAGSLGWWNSGELKFDYCLCGDVLNSGSHPPICIKA